VMHILWGCTSAQVFWACGPMKLQKSSSTMEKFVQIFNDMRIYTMQQGRIGAGSCSCSQDMVAGEFGGTW
jgi:hypothetical protein